MLAAGTTLGPYKILAPLGAGGMGEVYRAHDARLGRDVAIKVLPQHLAATPEVRARFEREARTISQLNHPHICTLHDVGHQDGTDYLVMELLEGETLAHRLEKGALPVAEVLSLGSQIAEALDRAHRAGVVHRDLKPGNIMLTKAGAKLMDFGLARAHGMAPAAGAMSQSPTVSRPLTAEGTIVGTFQYMAPEQLEGKEADARSDIWSLGCVLYEMATGMRAFAGESQASLIAAILKEEPRAMSELRPVTPPGLERLVRRCLAKDSNERFQSASDLAFALEATSPATSPGVFPPPVAPLPRSRLSLLWRSAAWLAGAAALVVVGSLTGQSWRGASLRVGTPTFFDLALPAGADISVLGAALSPDGRQFIFVGSDSRGSAIWMRSLDAPVWRKLAGTEGASLEQRPIWSPDQRFVLFAAENKVKRLEVASGNVETFWTGPRQSRPGPFAGDWNDRGDVLFSWGDLYRTRASGGEPERILPMRLTETDVAAGRWLPDGRHYLFFALDIMTGQGHVFAGMVGETTRVEILSSQSPASLADPGYLLFERSGSLVAQRFDARGLRVLGKPRLLATGVTGVGWRGDVIWASRTAFAFLRSGGGIAGPSRLTWFTRSGREAGQVGDPLRILTFDLSPDGMKVAAMIGTLRSSRLALIDAGEGTGAVDWLTDEAGDSDPRFNPAGDEVLFSGRRQGVQGLFCMPLRDRRARLVLAQSTDKYLRWQSRLYPHDWSHDGRWVLYADDHISGLVAIALDDVSRSVLVDSLGWPDQARFSPDGRWIAYGAYEPGMGVPQVYLSSFPPRGGRMRISPQGGVQPLWRGDSRELYYLSPRGSVLAVDVGTGPTPSAGPPRLLFETRLATAQQNIEDYAVTSDGRQFLMKLPVVEQSPAFTVVENWAALLK